MCAQRSNGNDITLNSTIAGQFTMGDLMPQRNTIALSIGLRYYQVDRVDYLTGKAY